MSPHGLHEQEQDPLERLLAQLPPDLQDSRGVPVIATDVRAAIAELKKCAPGTPLDDPECWWQRTLHALFFAGVDLTPWLRNEAPNAAAEAEREVRGVEPTAQAVNDNAEPEQRVKSDPLPLEEPELTNLRESGLTDESIRLGGFRTVRGEEIDRVLGWPISQTPAFVQKGKLVRGLPCIGLLIPIIKPGETAPYMHRVRLRYPRPELDDRGKPKLDERGGVKSRKYEGPKAQSTPVYYAARARLSGALQDVSRPLLVGEGEKKDALLDQLGYAAVGFVGVDCAHDVEYRKAQEATGAPKAEWYRLRREVTDHCAIGGRDIVIFFDKSDRSKPREPDAAQRIANMFYVLGAKSVRYCTPPPLGKSKGVDDLYVWAACRHGDFALNTGRDCAETLEAKLGQKELQECIDNAVLLTRDGAAGTSGEWPEAIPLRDVPVLPEWPEHSLTGVFGEWAKALAESTQTPLDMGALMGLVAVAVTVQRRLKVRLSAGWTETLSAFACAIADSGERKTAVYIAATAPLTEYQREQLKALEREIQRSETELDFAQKRLDAAIVIAAKATGQERHGAEEDAHSARAARDAARKNLVRAPVLMVGDTTQEALAQEMAAHGERMAVMSDEACGPIALIVGRYRESVAAELYLTAYTGAPYSSRRKSRDAIEMESPALSVGVMAQPSVIDDLAEHPELRGLGFLARIWWAAPRSIVGYRKLNPTPMPARVSHAYASMLHTLLRITECRELVLDHDAQTVFTAYCARHEPRLQPDGDLAHIKDFGSKLLGSIGRLAGLLHCAAHTSNPAAAAISGDTMERAIAVGNYLLAHAQHVLEGLGADPVVTNAQKVLDWLQREGRRTASRRDIHQRFRKTFPRVAAVDPVIGVLLERGWLRETAAPPRTGPGRSPSPAYEVRPAQETPTQNPQNPHNGSSASPPSDSEDCECSEWDQPYSEEGEP
jgi:hypothetical protein